MKTICQGGVPVENPRFEQLSLLTKELTTVDNGLRDRIVRDIYQEAGDIYQHVVTEKGHERRFLKKVDHIITSTFWGYPIMLLMLALVLWITITGANVPSAMLADGLFWVEDQLTAWFFAINSPEWLHGILILGMYRTAAWVISVMLPPMAIFFPLFTLLEDLGYLPRVAFNLDRLFKRAGAHGKQSLTMCMVKLFV